MFWKNIKYKDLIITVVLIIIISAIGIKLIENFPYFFNIIREIVSLLTPFIYGLIIAYILNPLVSLFEKRVKLKKGMAILITYTLIVGVLTLIGVYFIPSIAESTLDIARSVPNYIAEMQNWVYEFLDKEEIKGIIISTGTFDNINSIITQFGTMIVAFLEGSVVHLFSISSQIIKFIIGILISIYVLVDKDRFISGTKRLTFIILKPKNAEKVIEAIRIYHKMICSYIGIKAIDSAIIGVLTFILLKIFKSEYSTLLAVIIGVTNMIPYFGPLISEIIGFLFNVFISPTKAVTILLVILAVHFFDAWYLDPKLVGDKVGVRPVLIMLAVILGGGFFGPVGMLIASPTIATLKIYFNRMLERNKELISLADKI